MKIKLFLIAAIVACIYSCTEEEGTMPGNDGNPSAILYQYKADKNLYNPDNDAFIRAAVNSNVTDIYYLAQPTKDQETKIKSLGEEKYINYIIDNGIKINKNKFTSNLTVDFYVKNLEGDNTITVVSVGENKKSMSTIKFLGWKDMGQGKLKSQILKAEKDVMIKELEGKGLYKIISPYSEGYNIEFAIDAEKKTVTFNKQETGKVHKKYGMMSFGESIIDQSTANGKEIKLVAKLTVSAGSFGVRTETVILP